MEKLLYDCRNTTVDEEAETFGGYIMVGTDRYELKGYNFDTGFPNVENSILKQLGLAESYRFQVAGLLSDCWENALYEFVLYDNGELDVIYSEHP